VIVLVPWLMLALGTQVALLVELGTCGVGGAYRSLVDEWFIPTGYNPWARTMRWITVLIQLARRAAAALRYCLDRVHRD
jgi:hypothetical protein